MAIKTECFPNIQERVKKLEPIINEYTIDDVAMASFCVSVCVNNRSVLESSLALNWAVANHQLLGQRRIETYNDFKLFFERIKDIMKPDAYTDYIEEDFGEVSIETFGRKYYVIIGTGHNMVFACLQFLPYLAQMLDKRNELIEVLEYYSYLIEYLREDNNSDGTCKIRFVLPEESLFNKVKMLFSEKTMAHRIESIASIYDSDVIEKKHFIFKNDKPFPLANTSLLLDLYDLWYRNLDDNQKTKLVNNALTGLALSLSKLDKDNNISIMSPVIRLENEESKIPLEKFPFVLLSRKGIIFPINEGEYSPQEIDSLFERINLAIEKEELFLSESISRREDKKVRGILVEKNTPIEFLVIDTWANPSEDFNFMTEHGEKYHRCNALDVVYYMLFMRDVDELYDYICFCKEKTGLIKRNIERAYI